MKNRADRTEKIKLVICDMDGTFLKADKTISPGNAEAVCQLRKEGIDFSICTGRIHTMTDFYMEELQMDVPIITSNGAVIWDPKNRQILWDQPMDAEEVQRILEWCKKEKMDYCALTPECSYFSENNVRRARFEQYNMLAAERGVAPMELAVFDAQFACIKDTKVYKILIYEVEEGQMKRAEGFLQNLTRSQFTTSEPRLLDIMYRGVNKGMGLCQLQRIMGLRKEQVCAFGDYTNDIPMLEQAGISVAMENGQMDVKEAADYTTKSNEEDGVAWFIREYFSGGEET